MEQWKRLILPVGLGISAAVMNWITVKRGVEPMQFVMVTSDIARGDLLDEKNLARIELRGDLGSLPKAAPRYRDRHVLFRRPVTRDLKKGDILLWIDTREYTQHISLPIPLAGINEVASPIREGHSVVFRLQSTASESAASSSGDSEFIDVGPFPVVKSRSDTLTVVLPFNTDTGQLDDPAARLYAARNSLSQEKIARVDISH